MSQITIFLDSFLLLFLCFLWISNIFVYSLFSSSSCICCSNLRRKTKKKKKRMGCWDFFLFFAAANELYGLSTSSALNVDCVDTLHAAACLS